MSRFKRFKLVQNTKLLNNNINSQEYIILLTRNQTLYMCLRYNFILSVQRILLWFDHGCFYLFTWQHSKCFPFFGRGDHTICTYTCTKCYKSLYTRLCFLKLILKILKSCHQCAYFHLCFPKYHNFHFFKN